MTAAGTRSETSSETTSETTSETRARIGFLFPGQSSEYAGMGVELYREHPAFRAAIDRSADVFGRLTGVSPLDVFADADTQGRAELLQPALFLLQVALAEFWDSCGVTPDAVIGHSLGEYAAACVAGVFGVEEGLELVGARGRSFAAVPGAGRMVAVQCPDPAELEQLEQLVAAQGDAATVAAYNAPGRVTVSGTDDAMRELKSAFEQRRWLMIPLETTHAFHSALVAPAGPAVVAAAGRIAHRPPAVPLALNLTGTWAGAGDLGAEYWGRQLTSPVRFLSGVRELLDSGCTVFLEVGPGRTLTASGRRARVGGEEVWLPGLSARNPDPATVLERLDRLERAGVPVDWAQYHAPLRAGRTSVPAVASAGDLPELTRLALPRSAQRRYETTVGTRAPRMLADHRIAGRRVVPAAYHVACLIEAVADDSAAVVEDLVFPRALEVAPDARRVQLVLTPAGEDRFVAQSLALVPEDDPFADESWRVHAEGRIQRIPRSGSASAPPRPWTDPAGYRAGWPVSAAQIYPRFEVNGLRFGPAFRWIRELRIDGEDSTGDLVIAASSPRERTMALLDSCVQLAIAARIVRKPPEEGVLQPFRIERAVFHASRSAAECGVALVRHRAAGAARAVADVSLTDDAGHPLVELFGLELRALSPSVADPFSPEEAERLLASFHSLTEDQIEALLPWLAEHDAAGSTERRFS